MKDPIMNQEREQFDAELRDWSMVDHGDDLRIHGAIYGDRLTSGKHPFPDGEPVVTSTVFSVVDGIARTRSGTRYKLSALRSGGEGWRDKQAAEAKLTALVRALERIRDATPNNTNSRSAESMASWTHAVAGCALADHSAPPSTPTSAPVEDVGGLPCSPLQRARAVATMLMANLRLARGETGVKGWRSDYVAREYAALMGLNLDGPANLTATDLAVYAYPEAADEAKRRAFESGFLTALPPALVQPQPGDLMLCTTTCFECGHELHAPFCPACNPEMIQPQGEERS